MTISPKKTVETDLLIMKKCPRCGHPARAHQLPGMYRTVAGKAVADRTCKHLVSVERKAGGFRPCGCIVAAEDYYSCGSQVGIRVSKPACR